MKYLIRVFEILLILVSLSAFPVRSLVNSRTERINEKIRASNFIERIFLSEEQDSRVYFSRDPGGEFRVMRESINSEYFHERFYTRYGGFLFLATSWWSEDIVCSINQEQKREVLSLLSSEEKEYMAFDSPEAKQLKYLVQRIILTSDYDLRYLSVNWTPEEEKW